MQINRIKINGLINPIGFEFSHLNLSYCIESKKQNITPQVHIYADAVCKNEVYTKTLNPAFSFCDTLDFCPQLETRYYVVIKCENTVSNVNFFETGTNFDCAFITPAEYITHPVIFTEFESAVEITSARLYVTGVGLYQATINGKKVGNEYLTPNCNDYDIALQYQTYDVTEYIKPHNNLEISLGDGWYKGRFGLKKSCNIFGDNYAVAAKLVVKDCNGKTHCVSTDENWKARVSTICASGIYDGEIVDDTIDTSQEVSVKICKKNFNVIPRISLPVVCKTELKPQLIISPLGEKILDFKQNMSGLICFENRLKKGKTMKLLMGEVLQNGCFYRDNLRTAKAEYIYTSDGKQKTVQQKFTYYGFRYVLIEGLEKVDPDDFTAKVIYSDIEDTVTISTDSGKINRLLENCKWGQWSNFVDVPTDCPQRDERLGWTGDAQVFSRTACYQADCKAFYDKYIYDLTGDQKKLNGAIPMYSPSVKETMKSCQVWSDVATILPWNVYNFYGDKTLLQKHFPMMEAYVITLISADFEHGGRRLYDFEFQFGDWLAQDGKSEDALKGATDDSFIATMYYFNSVHIVSQVALTLELNEKYQYYQKIAEEIRNAILNEFFTSSGRLSIDTQTAYALCFNFGVYKDNNKLTDGFRSRIRKDNFGVKGGFVGATQLIQGLIRAGLSEEAFQILYTEKYPGWLHCVNLGATTIWERWNSLNVNGSVSSTGMNSFNHYSYGAVAEAFYGYIAGLKNLSPGFKNVEISPVFNYHLKKFSFKYASISGDYIVNYEIKKSGRVMLFIQIPWGCKGVLKIANAENFENKYLDGGNYNFEIKPITDLNHPFSLASPLCEILKDARTSKILKDKAPAYFYYFSKPENGLDTEPIGNTARISAFRVEEKTLQEIDLQLRLIEI